MPRGKKKLPELSIAEKIVNEKKKRVSASP